MVLILKVLQVAFIGARTYSLTLISEEADTKGRKISLAYCQPDVDKRLHINLGPDNKERKYVFNPFQLVMNRGHYYLSWEPRKL